MQHWVEQSVVWPESKEVAREKVRYPTLECLAKTNTLREYLTASIPCEWTCRRIAHFLEAHHRQGSKQVLKVIKGWYKIQKNELIVGNLTRKPRPTVAASKTHSPPSVQVPNIFGAIEAESKQRTLHRCHMARGSSIQSNIWASSNLYVASKHWCPIDRSRQLCDLIPNTNFCWPLGVCCLIVVKFTCRIAVEWQSRCTRFIWETVVNE